MFLLAELDVTPSIEIDFLPILRDLAGSLAVTLGPWLGVAIAVWLCVWLATTFIFRWFNYDLYRRNALSINPHAQLEKFNWLCAQWDRRHGVLESAGIDEGYLRQRLRNGDIDAASYYQLLRAVRREAYFRRRWEFDRELYRRYGIRAKHSEKDKIRDLAALRDERLLTHFERQQEFIAKYAVPEPLADVVLSSFADADDEEEEDLAEGITSFVSHGRAVTDGRRFSARSVDSSGHVWVDDEWPDEEFVGF